MTRITGPDFVALMVRDLERAADFYSAIGCARTDGGPPHAVVFDTQPCAFAVREPLPFVDLDATPTPGVGVALWLAADDAHAVARAVTDAGGTVVSDVEPGPFGDTFAFTDLDGYRVTVHDG